MNLSIDKFSQLIAQASEKEHYDTENFIKEFRTSHELLLKEQNNMINGLVIEVHQLSKVINAVLIERHDLKGITTRGGKSTFQISETSEVKNSSNDSPGTVHAEQELPKLINQEELVIEPKRSTLPFPNQIRKDKEDAYQRKLQKIKKTNKQ